jgi:DNA modification methylase
VRPITDVWSIPTSSGKTGHGAEFPLALAARCIALTSCEGDLVLDPFVGSGTTALAAAALGRRCLGYDISEPYVQIAEQRLKTAHAYQQYTLGEGTELADHGGSTSSLAPSTTTQLEQRRTG